MKKVLWVILSVLFIAGCSLRTESEKEEKFVNPLFYKQLSPLSSNSRETFLTPNSLRYSNSVIHKDGDNYKDGWTTNTCRLLENENDYIILKCQVFGSDEFYRYVPEECFLKDAKGICTARYIKEYSYDENWQRLGVATFVVELE